MLSDAESLIKALKESTYFWDLMNDQTLATKVADVAFTSKFSDVQ